MSELIQSIFLTGLLVSLLCVGYIRFKEESSYIVSDTEKAIVVTVTLLAFASWILSAFILIWI